VNTDHQTYLRALETKSYEKLFVRRSGKSCWLIIRLEGTDRVFVDRLGNSPRYRHAWQIRNWLRERFQIDPDSVPVAI
jgi:hypothetical protein